MICKVRVRVLVPDTKDHGKWTGPTLIKVLHTTCLIHMSTFFYLNAFPTVMHLHSNESIGEQIEVQYLA